jgi:hypothetical protein
MARKAEREIFEAAGLEEFRSALPGAGEFLGGNWSTDPWFCRENNDWLSEAGFPLQRCRELVEPLRRLFPLEVCRRILGRPLDVPLVFGLFQGLPGFLIPLLEAAASATPLGMLEGDPLLRAIRKRETFAAAASELSLWAAFVRAGFAVNREPAVLVGASVRRPDFGVQVGPEHFYVEAAQLQESALERASRLLEEEILHHTELLIEGREVRFASHDEFSRGLGAELLRLLEPGGLLPEYRARRFIAAKVLPLVRFALDQITAGGATPGVYDVPSVGSIEVITAEKSSAEVAMLAPPSIQEVAARVWRKVVEEARQLPSGSARVARGLVAVDVGSALRIPSVVEALLGMARSGRLALDGRQVSALDGILLRGRSFEQFSGRVDRAHLLVLGAAAPSPELLALTRATGGSLAMGRAPNESIIVAPHAPRER